MATCCSFAASRKKAGQLYGMGLIGGFCHLYIGQEAVVVGMQGALKPGDEVITSYRDHGHMLATGMEPRGVMAELTGRSGGYSKGKGGSMHMFSREKKFFGGHGIVGAQVSIGTGLAFANWYREDDHVAVTYFGDGAANQGQVFESFNLAALMKLPCIYVIENNKYGMGTSIERASASRDLSKNGAPWSMANAEVDGMDVTAVRRAAEEAVAHCRAGNGPFLAGNEDVSLPGAFDVRSGQISHPRRDPEDARGARLHRTGPPGSDGVGRGRGCVEGDRCQGSSSGERSGRIRAGQSRARRA